MEDILEELVGEIWDEHDEVEEHFEKLDENAYRVDCSASLEDFMEFFDVKLEMCIRDRLGLARPTSGSVELLGRKLDEESRIELLRETGSLIESPSGYLHLTARENLAIVCDLKGVSHREIDRVLDIVRLTGDANRRVGQYSLGMKQRLGIATALLGRPRLLILDEPTNGLDPAGIQEMRSLIASMPEATGATVLISSHLLGEMEQMVTQVGIIPVSYTHLSDFIIRISPDRLRTRRCSASRGSFPKPMRTRLSKD